MQLQTRPWECGTATGTAGTTTSCSTRPATPWRGAPASRQRGDGAAAAAGLRPSRPPQPTSSRRAVVGSDPTRYLRLVGGACSQWAGPARAGQRPCLRASQGATWRLDHWAAAASRLEPQRRRTLGPPAREAGRTRRRSATKVNIDCCAKSSVCFSCNNTSVCSLKKEKHLLLLLLPAP